MRLMVNSRFVRHLGLPTMHQLTFTQHSFRAHIIQDGGQNKLLITFISFSKIIVYSRGKMSAGRNLRPESTSYKETGIPCGNPSRYKSRGVIRMNTIDTTPFKDQRFDQPGEGTESEAEQQLKRMVQNQLDTSLTIESQKTKQRVFTSSSVYKSYDPSSAGTLSLKDYKTLEDRKKYVEELGQYGLTEEEIQFKLEQEGYLPKAPKKSKYGADPNADSERLQQLQKKIEEKEKRLAKPDSFSNVQTLSRHAMEVERSLNKGTEKAKTLSHLVQLNTLGSSVNDPILQTLLANKVISKASSKSLDPRSQESQNREKIQADTETGLSEKHTSLDKNTSAKFGGTSEDGRLSLRSCIVPVPEEDIMKNRLTLEEIREIPRFSDYSAGEPSKTLYLKNLSSKVSEDDLVSLFVRFQREVDRKIVFRLMRGRMKGQAFITFGDIETASKALNLVNGYLLKDKPVVILYGRQNGEATNDKGTKETTKGEFTSTEQPCGQTNVL